MTTLSEYKYGGPDAQLRAGIAETMEGESALLSQLNFEELTDNNVSRQRMYLDEGDIQEHSVGQTWTVVNPRWEYRDAPLAILGDNVTVDNFGQLASGQKDLMAGNIVEKSAQISRKFDKLAIYGGTTTVGSLTGSAMVGLLLHIARIEGSTNADLDGWVYNGVGGDNAAHNKQVVLAASGASAALALAMIRRLVDQVRPKATHIIMSRANRAKLETLCQAAGCNLDIQQGKFGQLIITYGEQRVIINDAIKDNLNDSSTLVMSPASYDYDQTATTAKDNSPVFAVNIGPNGFTGINGIGMIQVENLAGGGPMETLDAKGKRIKAYLGTALRHHQAAAVLLNASYSG